MTKKKNKNWNVKEKLLINVHNQIEANILIGLLEMSDIPCNKVDKGLGEVYLGSGNLGVDIYVTEDKLEEAKKIIESKIETDQNFEVQIDEDDSISQREYESKRIIFTWFMIILFFSPVIMFGVLYILSFIIK